MSPVALVERIYLPSSVAKSPASVPTAIGSLDIDLRGVGFRDESDGDRIATVATGSAHGRGLHLAFRSI